MNAPSSTKPYSLTALLVLRERLPFLHSENDPHSRDEVLSLSRRLLIRLRGGLSTIKKKGSAKDGFSIVDSLDTSYTLEAGLGTDLEDRHERFLCWYVNFLESELHPCASYQRHISALKTLLQVLQSGLDHRMDPAYLSRLGHDQISWKCGVKIFRPSLLRIIVDLLVDPFDDVRALSSVILRMFPRKLLLPQFHSGNKSIESATEISQPYSLLVDALSRAEKMASRTSRADHADTVARLYHVFYDLAEISQPSNCVELQRHKWSIFEKLLTDLEYSCQLPDRNFLLSLRETPFHGYLSALR